MFNLIKFILINCSLQVLRNLSHFAWRSQHMKASLQHEPWSGFNFGIFLFCLLTLNLHVMCSCIYIFVWKIFTNKLSNVCQWIESVTLHKLFTVSHPYSYWSRFLLQHNYPTCRSVWLAYIYISTLLSKYVAQNK